MVFWPCASDPLLLPPALMLCTIRSNRIGAIWDRQEAAREMPPLEHVPKKLLDFFDQDMLQLFDIELRPYRSNDSI